MDLNQECKIVTLVETYCHTQVFMVENDPSDRYVRIADYDGNDIVVLDESELDEIILALSMAKIKLAKKSI